VEESLPLETLGMLLSSMSEHWVHVHVQSHHFRPLMEMLLNRASRLPPIDYLYMDMQAYLAEDSDWENAACTDNEVRVLHRIAPRCRIGTMTDAPRYIAIETGPRLECNGLDEVVVLPWLRANIPFTRIDLGEADADSYDWPNPTNMPLFTDEVVHTLLATVAVHSPTLVALTLDRRQPALRPHTNRIWDGQVVLRLLSAYPQLTALQLHDAGDMKHASELLRLLPPRITALGLTMISAPPLTSDDWGRLRGLQALALTASMPLTTTRLVELLTNNPQLHTLDLDLGGHGMATMRDWSPLGECKTLQSISLRLPHPGITLSELRSIMGASHKQRIVIDLDAKTPYDARHRWPQPVAVRTFLSAIHAQVDTLRIGGHTSDDGRVRLHLLEWADEVVEEKLRLPPTDSASSSAVPAPDRGPKLLNRQWTWLTQQPGIDVAILMPTTNDNRVMLLGNPTSSTRVFGRDSVFFIQRDGGRRPSMYFALAGAQTMGNYIETHPELPSSQAIPSTDIIAQAWAEIASADATFQLADRRALELYIMHLLLLNPSVAPAALVQFILRPATTLLGSLTSHFAAWRRRMEREVADVILPANNTVIGTITTIWPTLFDPPPAAATAPMELVAPTPTAPRVQVQQPDAIVDQILRESQRRQQLDVDHVARRMVHQTTDTVDVSTLAPHAQLCRLDMDRTGHRMTLQVRHAALVRPLQRILTPLLRSVNITLHVLAKRL
jgi:hypothetical protein